MRNHGVKAVSITQMCLTVFDCVMEHFYAEIAHYFAYYALNAQTPGGVQMLPPPPGVAHSVRNMRNDAENLRRSDAITLRWATKACYAILRMLRSVTHTF